MKKYLVLLMLCLSCNAACAPHLSKHGSMISNGSLVCSNGTCCWPNKHHREVNRPMVCTHETINQDGWSSSNISLKMYFMNP